MKSEIFHILNRGVEKRKIFYSEKDYLRFAHNLYDFNNRGHAIPYPRRCKTRENGKQNCGRPTSTIVVDERLVDFLCWCFMPNHIHNLVQEQIDGGISNFSKKIFGGYTKYVNEIYNRSGVLFQGKSKKIKVTRDSHFFHLPFYIMANPIELIEHDWKEKGIKNLDKVIDFLENYQWSSFPDLIGKENFPLLTNKELFYELFQTDKGKFKKEFIEWLKSYKKENSGEFID